MTETVSTEAVATATLQPSSFEEEVGITEFLTNTEQFQGILKQRFSDFIVREVSKAGTACTLTSCTARKLEQEAFAVEDISADRTPNEICAAFTEGLRTILGPGAVLEASWPSTEEAIRVFLLACINKEEKESIVDNTSICPTDKAARTEVHQLIRRHLGKWVDSETVEIENLHRIRMLPRATRGSKDVPGLKRKRIEWPSNLGNYLQFTMMKENVDTLSAIAILSKNMRLKPGAIEYNGTKDKRGITAQKCTIYRRRPSDFGRINSYKLSPIIRLGDFEYVSAPARLGALAGNRFDIILRAITAHSESSINEACTALTKSGFINYFGLQRFGKGASKSHILGRELLQSNWERCVRLIFAPNDNDQPVIKEAKELFNAGLLKEALQQLPDKLHVEKTILRRLVAKPNDYAGAYGAVPKHVRLMCAHAYQSYVWNKAVSKRMKLWGLQCVEGDIVATEGYSGDCSEHENLIDTEGLVQPSSFSFSSSTGGDTSNMDVESGNSSVKRPSRGNRGDDGIPEMPTVHVVTAEDVANARYTIADVLMPLPGSEVIFPTHEVGNFYHELLAADGLTIDMYSTCNITYRMRGAYRRVVQQAQSLSWSVLHYTSADAELIQTELSAFRQTPEGIVERPETAMLVSPQAASPPVADASSTALPAAVAEAKTTIEAATTGEEEEVKGQTLTALKLQFFLPPGTYATMLLRELTKQSTDSMFQARLSSFVSLSASSSAPVPTAQTDA